MSVLERIKKSFIMLVIAQHTNITDPQVFWGKAQTVVGDAPAGFSVYSVFPSQDGKTGTCVWEASSADELQKFLDDQSEGLATNYCYEVNETASIGLPQRKKEAALN
jgi:hypothetical protein